jgi:branched-chain amino acid transport system ATP-binding protein
MTLLVVDKLNKAFGGVIAARDVTFQVAPGELVALIGPNGAGKSTTFNMVGGQLKPDSGTVTLDAAPISRLTPRAIWRKGVGRTFQIAQTFVSMTVAENVQMALQSLADATFNIRDVAHRLARAEAVALLEQVGMAGDADRPISTLAYGDVKRVELAIALAGNPKLLLMDEPTAGMAPKEREALMSLAARTARAKKLGVLFTEHDMDSVFGHADHILVLVRGEIIARGKPDVIRANERVREVYLGSFGTAAAAEARAQAEAAS